MAAMAASYGHAREGQKVIVKRDRLEAEENVGAIKSAMRSALS
jgi:hypothetical protein